MTNKRPINPIAVAINLIAIVFCMVGSIFTLAAQDANGFMKLTAVFGLIALISALVYVFLGYKKSAADFFKGFMYIYMLSTFTNILNTAMAELTDFQSASGIVFSSAIFGLLLILAIGRDMGKVKSFILCGIVIAISLAVLLGSLGTMPLSGSLLNRLFAWRALTDVILAATTGLMVYAKYADKTARGTK